MHHYGYLKLHITNIQFMYVSFNFFIIIHFLPLGCAPSKQHWDSHGFNLFNFLIEFIYHL